jgi:hypothetical protein
MRWYQTLVKCGKLLPQLTMRERNEKRHDTRVHYYRWTHVVCRDGIMGGKWQRQKNQQTKPPNCKAG